MDDKARGERRQWATSVLERLQRVTGRRNVTIECAEDVSRWSGSPNEDEGWGGEQTRRSRVRGGRWECEDADAGRDVAWRDSPSDDASRTMGFGAGERRVRWSRGVELAWEEEQ